MFSTAFRVGIRRREGHHSADALRRGRTLSLGDAPAQFTQFYTIGKLVPGPTTIFAALIGYAAMPKRSLLWRRGRNGRDVRPVEHHHDERPTSRWDRASRRLRGGRSSRADLAPAIVGLVWASVLTIARGTPAGIVPYAVTAVVAVLTLRTKLSAPLLIALSGVVGIIALR